MSFAFPAVLFALIALPAIWWLLRVMPPRPKTETFPPTRLLLEITKKEEEPSKTPWWLILLRMVLAALVILALAGPILRPTAEDAPGTGPLLLVMDNGWAAAERFDAMKDAASAILDLARDADRPVAFVATAEPPGQAMAPTTADEVAERVATLEPQPHEADAAGALDQLRAVLPTIAPFGGAVWVTDGVGGPDSLAISAFLTEMVEGPIAVYADAVSNVLGLLPPDSTAEALTVPVIRQGAEGPPGGRVVARDLRGRVVADATFAFETGAAMTTARFELPSELRNDIVRLEIAGQETAGAVQLLDERYRRRTVGIISGTPSDQPLLAADYYVTRALVPFADLREPSSSELPQAVAELIAGGVSVIVLADIGTIPPETEAALSAFAENGGTLIRFAGPRLAAATPTLIPAPLRLGGRTLGGTLSWETPQPLGEFPRSSPFFGLAVPDDVFIEQQVLAEPNAELAARTYASLADGTPLVTGAPFGDGLLVLFHVTADPAWSNLPLSGVFVEMLRRIVAMSNTAATPAEAATATAGAAALNPYRVLDGFGRFVDAGPATEPIPSGNAPVAIDRSHPPGLYGAEDGFRALSLLETGATLPPLELAALEGATLRAYPDAAPVELRPWLLAGALALFLLDALAVLWLNGAFAARRRAAAAMVLVVAGALVPAWPSSGALAQGLTPADQMALNAATRTPLAYVITGDQDNDDLTLAGLRGLSIVLAQRTSFEPGDPVGLNLEADELAFYPIIYWRVTPNGPMPTPAAVARLDAYMRNGGTVLFDTADQLEQATLPPGAVTAAGQRLRDMMATLDLPPLEPVPPEHVVTKSFYLLTDFPGRLVGGRLWVEAGGGDGGDGGAADGVSPILVTSNDFAGAWAVDARGAFLLPTGSGETRQREFAFRVGINIVMYALTGNYKTDQVHVPAILERLGQ